MKRRILSGIWHVLSSTILVLLAIILYASYMVCWDPGSVPQVYVGFLLLAVFLSYHLYRLFRVFKPASLPGKEDWRLSRRLEIVFLIAVILIIAVVAPNRVGSRPQSNESAAIGNLRTIRGAQNAYNSATGIYAAKFADLTGAKPPFLDGNWDASKNGYDFTVTGRGQAFQAIALPHSVGNGIRAFYVDETGVIRYTKDGLKDRPNAQSTPLEDQ